MITTGSKFFYALAGLLFLTAVVYGYSTGDGSLVGPISLGFKGGVGDLVGYTILMGASFAAAFLGFATTAFRDADPEATAELLGAEAPPAATVPGTSYWPVVGAFGVVVTVVGLVLNNVFFVAGLIAMGAVAIEWTMQTWAERATGDPAVNREIRNRIMFPLEVPLAGALVIAVLIIGYSRVFLALSAANAVWAALFIAAAIFVVGTVLASRPTVRPDLVAGLLALVAVATIGFGIFAAVQGERDFEHHGEESDHSEEEDHSPEGGATEEEGAAVLEESN